MLSQVRFYAVVAPLAGAFALTTPASAAPGYFWADSYQSPDVDIYRDDRETPRVTRRVRPSVLPPGADKAEKLASEGKKPQGPLTIAISIQRQQVKVYDSNGLFAESPISSGMAGHSTPMGVFSIIQKHKFHRSNIYSGAPMPYMQRITWSGVAMHAGVLPGYPASHGCIRMPMSFAMKMWGWTRMGARVVVTPAEVSPANFVHPVLASLVPPGPVAAAPAVLNVKTADASGSIAGGSQKVMTDITASADPAVPSDAPADVPTVASIVAAEAASDLAAVEMATNDGLPAMPTPSAVDFSDLGVDLGDVLRPGTDLAAQEATGLSIDTDAVVTAAVDVATSSEVAALTEAPKDQAQLAPTLPEPAPVVAAQAIKRNVPVAILISRKDARLYVRQSFTPLFDMPIEIAPGDKALGTHVFTARTITDEDKLQWSVTSMPAVARQASATVSEGHRKRSGRNSAVEIVQVTQSTAKEALTRLSLPADLMARLGDALPTGSSLVVTDQGIKQGETGEGTDFIVRLR